MPNIKIYGLNREQADVVFNKIKEAFKNEPSSDIVVTRVESTVIDLASQSQPYIQLELDDMNGYSKKIEKLKTLGMDIQVIELHAFIPKGT